MIHRRLDRAYSPPMCSPGSATERLSGPYGLAGATCERPHSAFQLSAGPRSHSPRAGEQPQARGGGEDEGEGEPLECCHRSTPISAAREPRTSPLDKADEETGGMWPHRQPGVLLGPFVPNEQLAGYPVNVQQKWGRARPRSVPGPKKAAILKSCDDEAADRLRCRGESRRDGVLRQGKTCGFSEPNIELIAAADRVSFVEFLSHTCSVAVHRCCVFSTKDVA